MIYIFLFISAVAFVLWLMREDGRARFWARLKEMTKDVSVDKNTAGPKLPVTAKLATEGQLPTDRVPGAAQLVVGKANSGRTVWSKPDTPFFVIGSTRSGKTRGVLVPNILEWFGGVIASTTKVDLIRLTIGWRQKQGPVAIYDPSGELPSDLQPFARPWSPLVGCFRTNDDGERVASITASFEMATALISAGSAGGQDKEQFFNDSAVLLLAPLFLLEAHLNGCMRDINRYLARSSASKTSAKVATPGADDDDDDDRDWSIDSALAQLQALVEAGVPDVELAREMLLPITGYADVTKASIIATANRALRAFKVGASGEDVSPDDPRIITPEMVINGGTIYIAGSSFKQDTYKPLYTAFVENVLSASFSAARANPSERLDKPLLLALDEFPNTAPIPAADKVVTQAGGHGIIFLAACHSQPQLAQAYGENTAQNMLSNSYAVAVLPNVKDYKTLRWVQDITGDHFVEEEVSSNLSESESTNRGELTSAQRSTSTSKTFQRSWRALAAASALSTQDESALFALIGPLRTTLHQNWYDQDATLAERSQMEPTPPEPIEAPAPKPRDSEGGGLGSKKKPRTRQDAEKRREQRRRAAEGRLSPLSVWEGEEQIAHDEGVDDVDEFLYGSRDGQGDVLEPLFDD